jgi:hypothetical protein
MTHRIYCGTFESEIHWRDPALAKLPFIPDPATSRMVETMDEMLFAFCDAGDRVVTARPMNEAHVEYLHEVGFQFSCNRFSLHGDDAEGSVGDGRPQNVFELMKCRSSLVDLTSYLEDGGRMEPFAVLSGTVEAACQYGLHGRFPPLEVIRSVNRKSYSLDMRERLGIPNVSAVVYDVPSLLEAGAKLLQDGPFLIKDDYGVSGKGNQLVNSDGTLKTIARHLTRQAARNLEVRFVLEPYLKKQTDFSCQFRVEESGAITMISVQHLLNNGLAFGTSCSASETLLEKLERSGYFTLMARVGAELHMDGYHGDVCVDSMLLTDGELCPLVEINARKSMSLIKHSVDCHLAKAGVRGCLTSVAAVNERNPSFSGFLEQLKARGILFDGRGDLGVLPLTAGTVFGDASTKNSVPMRGKLYLAAVCSGEQQRASLITSLSNVMEDAGLRVMH